MHLHFYAGLIAASGFVVGATTAMGVALVHRGKRNPFSAPGTHRDAFGTALCVLFCVLFVGIVIVKVGTWFDPLGAWDR